MKVAVQSEESLKPTPKQCKLLGATVRDVGVIVAVTTTLAYAFAVVEDERRATRIIRFADRERDDVTFAPLPQPHVTRTERVAYNTGDEVYSLVPVLAVPAVALPVVLPVAA